ncbi:MAG: hypothetical protein ABH880_02950 [Patescibacteria group bacterium]
MTTRRSDLNSRLTTWSLREALALIGSAVVWVGLVIAWPILRDWQRLTVILIYVGVVIAIVAVILSGIHNPKMLLGQKRSIFPVDMAKRLVLCVVWTAVFILLGVFFAWPMRQVSQVSESNEGELL